MKKFISKITSLLFAVLLVIVTLVPVSAAEDELTINSEATAKVGDTVKYTLYLDESIEDLTGFELRLYYDDEYLSYVENSLEFEKFKGVISNPNNPGIIEMCWTNIAELADFTKKAMFLSAEFEVTKAGEAEISEYITEMYDFDLVALTSYKLTYSISVNGEEVLSDKAPVINSDSNEIKAGNFPNYADGYGDDNSPNAGEHYIVGTQVATYVVDVTQAQSGTPNSETSFAPVYVIVAVVVIILAIVAILFIRKKDTGNNEVNSDNEINNINHIN